MSVLKELARKTIPIRTAAEVIGCTERMVHKYIEAGKLESAKVGHGVFLSKAEVKRFAEARSLTKLKKVVA